MGKMKIFLSVMFTLLLVSQVVTKDDKKVEKIDSKIGVKKGKNTEAVKTKENTSGDKSNDKNTVKSSIEKSSSSIDQKNEPKSGKKISPPSSKNIQPPQEPISSKNPQIVKNMNKENQQNTTSKGPIQVVSPKKKIPEKTRKKNFKIPKIKPGDLSNYCKGDDLNLILHPKKISRKNLALALIFSIVGFLLVYLSKKIF